ncbi:MAG: ATP-binding protein [Gemmatimonadaceae bacterium]
MPDAAAKADSPTQGRLIPDAMVRILHRWNPEDEDRCDDAPVPPFLQRRSFEPLTNGAMEITSHCPLAESLAASIRAARDDLTVRWLDRIAARVRIHPNRVFPTEELLDHIPLLIAAIADYLENPADEVSGDMPVVAKAMELGELRFAQGFDTYEILKEYELLGGVLFSFLAHTVDAIAEPCSRSELLQCMHRVFRAVMVIQQMTTTHFLRKATERVREREERLRGFNRMVSHELKNRTGAILGARAALTETEVSVEKQGRFLRIIGENAEGIRVVLENLVSLSRLEGEARQQRNVHLREAAVEAARQLREFARSRGVEIRIDEDMPDVEVNAAAVELCLTNYLSNAIKYSNQSRVERWVNVSARMREAPDRPPADDENAAAAEGGNDLVVEVSDNGIGVPGDAQRRLFERFFRAHEETVTGIEGTGLGLSIVRDTVQALGGMAWADNRESGGSIFAFSLPYRRTGDRSADAREEREPERIEQR